MSRARTTALTLAAITATASLAACSSSGGGPARTGAAAPPTNTTASSTAASSQAPAPTSSAAPSSGSNGGGTFRPGPCAESQLRASVQAQDVGLAGRHVVRLIFLNKSGQACTLTGYPGAAIVDSSGKQYEQAKRVVGGPVAGTVERVATITVQPGHSVFAYLEGQSTREQGAAQAGCDAPKYPKILVTPPNTDTPVPFTIGWPVCYSFDVHPVREQ